MVQNIAIDGSCRRFLVSDRRHERRRGDPGNYAPIRRDKIYFFWIQLNIYLLTWITTHANRGS